MKPVFLRSNLRPDPPKPYKSVLPKTSTTHKRTHSLHFDVKKPALLSAGSPENHHRTMSSNKSLTPEIDKAKSSNSETCTVDREVSAIWELISQRNQQKTKPNLTELSENIELITANKQNQTTRNQEQRAQAKRLLLDRFNSRRAESQVTPKASDYAKLDSLDASQRIETSSSVMTEGYRECLRML